MVTINKTSSKPYYEQLMLGIKEDILQGILLPGDKLPSVREMAQQLMMNPNTISKAYKLLENEQVLVTVKGKGTFINEVVQEQRDEIRIARLKERFHELVIEAKHLGISKKELIAWVNELFLALGGETDED